MQWLFNFFKPKKGFVCGGEKTIEINDKVDKSVAFITYRMPNGDEMLNYVHTQVQDDKSELRKLDKEKLSSYELHESIRRKQFIPYARRIITKIKGYYDKEGNEINNIDHVEKYFPHHLEIVCSVAFAANTTFKKKD